MATLVALFTFFGIAAQETLTPYSKFGYGILNNNATSAQRQMGGVGYAMSSGRQINVMNPASYAAIDSLTFLFDMGVDFTILNSDDAGVKSNSKGGGLDYVTLQFPLGRRMGMSVGLLPFSSVGYSFGSAITNGANSREGSGGLNQLYLGVGGRVFKGFNIGINMAYLFGHTINDVYAVTTTGSTSLFEQVFQVRDWRLQIGAQYSYKINRDQRVTLGVSYTPGKTLLGHANVVKYDVSANETPDTLSYISLKNNFSLPETWGAGVSFEMIDRLLVEADVTYQPWKNAKFAEMPDFEATRFSDRWQVGLGVQYTPSQRGSYLKRLTYRAGGFFNHDYMMVGTNNVREYGLSCGFGLPTLATRTMINIGFEYRHRQAHPNPLLKENYFNITLGVNLNELWFFQNKLR